METAAGSSPADASKKKQTGIRLLDNSRIINMFFLPFEAGASDETKVELPEVAKIWNNMMTRGVLPEEDKRKYIWKGLISLVNAGYNTLVPLDRDWDTGICHIVAPVDLASHYSHCGITKA